MIQDNRYNSNGRRESIWSLKRNWRAWYSMLFVLQIVIGMGYVCWYEWLVMADDSIEATIREVFKSVPIVGAIAAISTVTLLEGIDIMMGARDYINEVIERRRTRKIAEAKAEGIRLMKDWYARKEQAEARGEDFNEPPPTA